ncbi:MAG TPA: aldolase/citrate lyase family protein [Lapillicoccus sp.]
MPATDLAATLRAAAADRNPSGQRGLWVSFLSAYGLEAVLGAPSPEGDGSGTGAGVIAWVGLDLQHGDLGLDDVIPLLRVADRAGVAVLPRLASHAGAEIGRVVDAGVQGVIVPGVESADEARALVRAIRLPPAGGRSTGAARTSLGVTDGGEPLLLPMVETAAGLAAAAEIAAVPGVDGIFIGPYDLSMSLGCQPGEEPVMTAIAFVVATVRAAGKIVGMFTGRPDLLALAQNLDLIGVDTDVTAVRRGMAELFS